MKDQERAVIGGMITGRTVKATRTNNMMAFLTVEDLYGTVEVIVFPRDYEKYRTLLEEDAKVFIQGRVTVEEDKPAKLICSGVVPFDAVEKNCGFNFQHVRIMKKQSRLYLPFLEITMARKRFIFICRKTVRENFCQRAGARKYAKNCCRNCILNLARIM